MVIKRNVYFSKIKASKQKSEKQELEQQRRENKRYPSDYNDAPEINYHQNNFRKLINA